LYSKYWWIHLIMGKDCQEDRGEIVIYYCYSSIFIIYIMQCESLKTSENYIEKYPDRVYCHIYIVDQLLSWYQRDLDCDSLTNLNKKNTLFRNQTIFTISSKSLENSYISENKRVSIYLWIILESLKQVFCLNYQIES